MQNARVAAWLDRYKGSMIRPLYDTHFDPTRLAKFGIEGVEKADIDTLARSYLVPLVGLLAEYLRTGDESYRDVYLDERLRYAPHKASREVRRSYFDELLKEEKRILLEIVAPGSDLEKDIAAALDEIHTPLLQDSSGHQLRLLAIGDCLMNEIRVFLPSRCAAAGIDLDMRCFYFSAVVGRKVSTEQVVRFLEHTAIDVMALSFLTYEGLPLYRALMLEAANLSSQQIDERVQRLVGVMQEFMDELRARTDVPFLLHNVSGLPLGRWRKRIGILAPFPCAQQRVIDALNLRISELVAHTSNCLLIDEAKVAEMSGHRECQKDVVPKRIAMHAMFHTSRFGALLCPAYLDVLQSFQTVRRTKVLLVDFDNTLWDGVMAEGAVHHHKDRQQLLRELKESGILLAAVSKNDPKNIRWHEMLLREEDFVVQKISWEPKVNSIRQIAAELDLGMDSFILLDDSPEEREFVRSQLPKVTSLDSQAPFSWRSLERMLQFPNTRQTEEARSRTELYRSQVRRKEALTQQLDDTSAMMTALDLHVKFGTACPNDLDRVSELVHRTNQFNTTTIRYPKTKLDSLMRSTGYAIYVAEMSDKFGSLGIVAVVVIERKQETVFIESFVMSCRAMGFGLEQLVLLRLLDQETQASRFVGRIIPTDRNGPVMFLFSQAGFASHGDTEWVWNRGMPTPSAPEWFKLQGRDPS